MYVDSLDKMSKMVAEVPNLFWEGFDVIEDLGESANAVLKKNARFIEGAWHKVNVIKLTEKGWKVPKSWLTSDGS